MTTETTGTATTDPAKLDLASMSVEELNKLIEAREEKHKSQQKHLKALARAKEALA